MPFTLSALRAYLFDRHRIPPEQVWPDTDFGQNLHLSAADINHLLATVAKGTGLPFLPDTARHLTTAFDLQIHVILRLDEAAKVQTTNPIPDEWPPTLPDSAKHICLCRTYPTVE